MTETSKSQINARTKNEGQRRSQTIWIGLVTGFLFAIVSVVIYTREPEKIGENIWSIIGTVILSLTYLTGAWLAWKDRITSAGMVLLGATYLIALTTPIIGDGQGIVIGVLVLIIGVGITTASLPPNYAIAGNASSMVVAAAVIVLDQIIPSLGLPSEPIFTSIAAFVLSMIFIFVLARQFSEFTLRAKLLITFSTVIIVPLVILGVYNNYQSAQNLNQQTRNRLSSLSISVAETVDSFFNQSLDDIRTEAKNVALQDFINLSPLRRENSEEKRRAEITLQSFQRKDALFIDSYGILDLQGKNILDTTPEDFGRDESKQPYFTEVIKSGAPYASNLLFIEEGEQSFYLSAPIKDPGNRTIGVLRVEYRATILQAMVHSVAPSMKDGIVVSIVDPETYLRITYTGNRDRLFKSYKNFSALEFAALQTTGKLPEGAMENVIVGADDIIVNGIDNLDEVKFFDAYSGSLGANTINTGTRLKTQPWIALVRESYAATNMLVQQQTSNTILISLGLSGIGILLALIAAQVIASPLTSLTKVAEQIASGDINARANISTADEIGALALSFNRMTDEINMTLSTLEDRVSERTTDLESAQRQSEKRAKELESISEISKIITSEQKLDILLPLITRLVSERFGFYHTGIFLLDETRQFAVLQAANSEGGRRMLARNHRLELGYGIVGYVAKSGIHRIALDVGLDSAYFNNPDLPTTRSEMSLPLKIRNQVIGVLDVQSELANAFTENDAKNLSILTDQISIALENARLFERTQQALNEMQVLYRQNLQESWVTFSREESMVGYHQTVKGGAKIQEPIESDDIRQSINRGMTLLFNQSDGKEEPSIVIPIKLRGQVIGTLKVKAPAKDRNWTNDEITLAETISERLSIALENARLIQESQRQVIKQQTIRDMTEKISTSINLKNVLQTAVEELGRVIPGSEVVLKLTSKEE